MNYYDDVTFVLLIVNYISYKVCLLLQLQMLKNM